MSLRKKSGMLKIYCVSEQQCWILEAALHSLGSLFVLSCPSVQVEVKTADIMVNIPEYYEGKNVLITGATGFMGKVRCCLNMHWTDTTETQRARSKHPAQVVIVFLRLSKGVSALVFNNSALDLCCTRWTSVLKGSSCGKHSLLLFNDSAVEKSDKLDECSRLKMALWTAAVQGAAGEAAEVLPGSQRGLCDGQAKGWSKPSHPRRRHGQLQGERRANVPRTAVTMIMSIADTA